MRVLFILDRLSIGGAELHTMKLASELTARGHAVETVVLLAGGSPDFPIDRFPRPPQQLGGRRIASMRLLRRLDGVIAREMPDAVFAVNQSALVVTTLVRVLGAKIPRLVSIFHTTVIASLSGRARALAYKWCTARADALIFVSKRQRDYWLARSMRSRQVLAIPNGIDALRFNLPPPEARAKLRQQFGLAETDLVLLLVGRFAPEKNHAWLLQVLAEMRAESLPEAKCIRLVFIGEGPLRASLEAQVQASNLEGQVIFAGAHRDVAPLLAMGDAGLLVSHSIETFSLAALELMASGLPMIMTNTGGAAEILEDDADDDQVGGVLIPVGDSVALRCALLEMTNRGRRSLLGAAARRRVVSRFTSDVMVDHYERFLAQGRN